MHKLCVGTLRMITCVLISFNLVSPSLYADDFDGGIRIEPVDPPWEGQNPNPWDPMVRELRVTNETGVSWQVDGFRATWPNFTGRMERAYQGGEILQSVVNVDDGYGEDRWTILISDHRGSGWNESMLKVMDPGAGVTLPLNIWDTPENNWEPVQPFQYLIKTGTFGNDYGYIDHPGIRVDTLYRYLENPEYYNPDHYVPNWMGKRGGPYSGGFIDTWMTQDSLNPVPVTQLQINFLPDDVYIRMNGYDTKYRPDMMGQWTPAGKGPMYAMSLAMVQEYMNIDMQLMDAIGTHESMAALEIMKPDYDNTNPDSDYNSQGLFYSNPNTPEGPTGWNATQEIGTMHYIESSYDAYAVQSFPKFFPYTEEGERFTKYFMTPGSNTDGREYGFCGGNNATMANTGLINSLYMWYGFNLFYNSTSFDYRTIAPLMADQEFAAKLFMASWNGGWGIGHEQLFYDFHEGDRDALINDPDVFDRVPNNGYVARVYQALPKLVEANEQSVLNPEGPQTAEVYDDHISKEMVAEFYFGMNVDEEGNSLGTSIELAEAGELGKQGLLWHFRLSESQRVQIWNSLNTAFDKMKGQAPSTEGTEYISLRYDWITLMRVAKYYLNLDIPVPVYSEFMSWIEKHSEYDRVEGVDVRDTIYPTMIIDETSVTFDSDRNFSIEVTAEDNEFF
ncbi:hypothetical protein [Chitinivibrio alkaliphilus]|uniref:Uncharacterized protein n=1 Tax=Chitinivibrio alkaliphilus ACht1 TaxID=1313304 RepID=U7D3F8_9BACT|nr:hypothetical protein [Chitinivibrio alkaliphilus]ERP31039.1 hypothetical protein CALK_2066 [Chitinivibrio alkaliphilus ACht1]